MGWRYVDRGDPSNYDIRFGYDPENWVPIQDAEFHDLDFSGVVPLEAKKVRLNVVVRADNQLRTFEIRRPDQQYMYNVNAITTQVGGVHIRGQWEVMVDSTRILKYYCTRASTGYQFNMICITVEGWWVED